MSIDNFNDEIDDDEGPYRFSYAPTKRLKPITLGIDEGKLERLKKLAKSESLRETLKNENRRGFSYWSAKGYADLLRLAADDFLAKYEPKPVAAPAKKKTAKKATKRTAKKAAKKAAKKKATKLTPKKAAKKSAKRGRR